MSNQAYLKQQKTEPSVAQHLETVKEILKHTKDGSKLHNHPWAQSLFVQEFRKRAQKNSKDDGQLLLEALADFFKTMLPSTPPRHGKRLDTSWGQFGMLAAMYFADIEFNFPAASSLRDAWGKIDNVISLYVRQKYNDDIARAEEEKYYLLSDEKEITPISTLSDWHARGLERFSKLLRAHQERLNASIGNSEVTVREGGALSNASTRFKNYSNTIQARVISSRKIIGPVILGFFALVIFYFGWVGLDIYRLGTKLASQGKEVKAELASGIDLQRANELSGIGPSIHEFYQTAEALSRRSAPIMWLTARLSWLPFVGDDLAAFRPLLEITELTAMAADELHQGVSPVLDALSDESSSTSINEIASLLEVAAPQFKAAVTAAEQAATLRSGMDLEGVHPIISALVINDFDPTLSLLTDSARLMNALMPLMGMGGEPADYLVLLQNEDELRATGGFITAVGGLVLQDGKILSFDLENSYDVDDYDYPYPSPPWQLEAYMDAPILVLRDSNWRPDFPIVAEQAEILYAYSRAHTVDGVIALDQHALGLLVAVLGSVQVGDVEINSENVLTYMQAERGAEPFPGEKTPENTEWWKEHRKDFMQPMAEAILDRLRNGTEIPWRGIVEALENALTEKHILLQFDDPTVALLLDRQGWDGQLEYSGGDYLMLVDSNVGFTKSNAVVSTLNTYDIDLSDVTRPTGVLSVSYFNSSSIFRNCEPNPDDRDIDRGDYEGLINQCYWTYLRVYKPNGTRISSYSAQKIPGEWMLSGQPLPARVDYLDEVLGFAEFGTMIVVPTQRSETITLSFDLPPELIQVNAKSYVYRLTIQKQAGVRRLDLDVAITLPPEAQVNSLNLDKWVYEEGQVSLHLSLVRDTVIEFAFSIP